jgi:hypothetical protein
MRATMVCACASGAALKRAQTVSFRNRAGVPGPFWGRHYIFWSGDAPLTLIYEVFSPKLAAFLGPEQTQA